jgi:broad specificity phosphatase PhoE
MKPTGRTVPFAVLRHAPTVWNGEKRLQGMSDTPLSAEGESLARTWRLPAPADAWRRVCSPLLRARRTAELLQPGAPVTVDSRLREMSFGVWEGLSIAELRTTIGERFLLAEQRGLDFEPPGGESPRQVMARLGGFTSELARTGQPAVIVAHKAVLRALLALATGWDMTGRQPVKLDWHCLHYFSATPDGAVTLDRPNVSMAAP